MSQFPGVFPNALFRFPKLVVSILVVVAIFQTATFRSKALEGKPGVDKGTRASAQVDFDLLDVAVSGDRAWILWSTKYESDVLGYRIWRETPEGREAVNEQLIPGSALKVANRILDAGDAYRFADPKSTVGAAYYVEAILLNGDDSLVGPVYANGKEFDVEAAGDWQPTALGSVWARAQKDNVEFADSLIGLRAARGKDPSPTSVPLPADPNALKFEIRQAGWYSIPPSVMQLNGFPMNATDTWKMYNNGQEVAIQVSSQGAVEFFGLPVATIQSDSGIYWLTFGSGSGKRVPKSTQKYSQSIANGWTRVNAERSDKAMRIASILNGDRENWYAGYVSSTETATTLNLTEIATESGESAIVGVNLQGIGIAPHNVAVNLNGSDIGTITFADYQRTEWTAPVSLSALRNGSNEIRLRAVGSSVDYSLLETVSINYPKRLTAEDNGLELSLASRKAAKLRGFSSSVIRVFDVTNPESVTEINPASKAEGDGTYSVTIASAAGNRHLIARSGTMPAREVNGWTRNSASNLKSTSNGADLVMIAPPGFNQGLQNLKNARESRGLRTVIVDPTDIYDEFNFGVRSAEAIRSFLQYAYSNWSVRPTYAILVGDASVDPKNYTGAGGDAANLVPTMFTDTWNLEAVSDTLIADFDGDGVEDLAIGRLPVRTSSELDAVVSKILAHDGFTREQIMNRGNLLISDAYVGYNFENGSRAIAETIAPEAAVTYADVSSTDSTTFRQNLLLQMSSGPAVVNYFGHASVTFWANQQVYRTSDANSLTNGQQPSLMVMLACLNGTFAETSGDSLSEATIKSSNGGAFGIWAASGWNGAYEEEILGKELYRRLYSGMTIGEAARETKSLFTSMDLRRTFMFFGDPSQRLLN